MKVVINDCFGGFGLSDEACKLCIERGMTCSEDYRDNTDFIFFPKGNMFSEYYRINDRDDKKIRTNPIVIRVVEELGEEANGSCADLSIVEIPFDSTDGWYIHEYNGRETIEEYHRSWG